MLQRVLFVAGMTVGVVAPIVWGAYVSRRPVPVAVQRVAAHEPAQPQRTAAARPALAVSPAGSHAPPIPAPTPIKLAMSSPLPAAIQAPHADAPALASAGSIGEESASRALARAPLPKARPQRQATHRTPPREHNRAPAVVSRYIGPHIIVVCAELTAREKRHAGCR